MPSKRVYKRRPYRKKIKGFTKAKKLVTGRGPTFLDRLASGVGSVAKLATAVAPAIAAINTEHKYSDKTSTANSHTPGTSDSIINLCDQIAQGTGDANNRIGNSILAKHLQLRLAMNFATQAGPPQVVGLHCRMMLVCWKEDNTQNPITAAKLFEQPTNLYSPVNKDHSDQFVVIKDKFFSLNAQNGALNGIPQAFTTMKIFKPLNWHIRYNGTAGNTGTQNNIFLILRSSASGVLGSLNTTYYSRIDFTDN